MKRGTVSVGACRTQKEQRKLQKRMAERLLDASDDKVNRNIKDSVFCDLFGRPEYLM